MKNNPILSLMLWLLAAILGILYFITDTEDRELRAIIETNAITKTASSLILDSIEDEIEYLTFIGGRNPKDIAILKNMQSNHFMLDTLIAEERLDWKELKFLIDTTYTWIKLPPHNVLDCINCTSEKDIQLHQNLLYKVGQSFLRQERSKIGEFQIHLLKFELQNLDSVIHISNVFYGIHPQIAISPNLNQLKSYSNSFILKENDTVVFKVLTEFYSKERETETKYYQVIAKDKKGTKIHSPFDYEEIK